LVSKAIWVKMTAPRGVMSPKPLPSDRPLEGLGRALESLRLGRGLSRGELARAAGVAPETIGRWEKEGGQPSLRVLESLLAALGAHLGDLFAAQVAAWHEPLAGWPAAKEGGAAAPGTIPWLELRARVGRLHQQLERLQAAVYGESVDRTRRLVRSLNQPAQVPEGVEQELAAAAERLRELHNILQVEPAAALDLQAEYDLPSAEAAEGESGTPPKR
jgi:transcriptional regulator with XRE-family HTH domain